MAKNSLRRLQDKGPKNVYLVRWAMIGAVAAVIIASLFLLMQPGKPAQPVVNNTVPSPPAQPAQPVVNNTAPPLIPPAEPVNETPATNDTATGENATEAVNGTEDAETEVAEETADEETEGESEDVENETEEPEDEAEQIVRPKKSNVLQRIEVVLGGKTSAASCYIAEDTWIRLDGVVVGDVDFSNHHGIVIYADWMISEKEILDSIYPRFSSTVMDRDNCTYNENINTYCCPGETCQYVKDLDEQLS